MAKFPEPPTPIELRKIRPVVRILSRGTVLWRVYFRGGPYPTTWNGLRAYGPTGNRFDHHEPPSRPQARAILYAARRPVTCFAEVFQETRTIDTRRMEPWLAAFVLRRAVPLLDLRGVWPTRAGASMAINSGPRPRARQWSRAIYEAYPAAEGLSYSSSMHANQPAVALYERARRSMPVRPAFNRALVDPAISDVVQQTGAGLGYLVV
ncbi:MAG: RES family NAD+ phosphorylase [Planctomycetes bacterium]|nr:RES family NAD+ phosphorylase [Planctomycetota bacterium]